jgi:hypothetical protein
MCAIAWHSPLQGGHANADGDAIGRLRISFLFITKAHTYPHKHSPKKNTHSKLRTHLVTAYPTNERLT